MNSEVFCVCMYVFYDAKHCLFISIRLLHIEVIREQRPCHKYLL